MTNHARQRCAEMKISTKVAKRIVQHADVIYPGAPSHHNGACIYLWAGEPLYAVCAIPSDPPLVLSVLFHTAVAYERDGATYTEKETPCAP